MTDSIPGLARPRRLLRPLACALVLAAALSGCSEGVSPSASSQPISSAWQNALSGIDDDGTVSTNTALELFGAAFGALPGAPEPTTDSGDVPSATLAVESIAAHWADLDDAQHQAALDAVPELADDTGAASPVEPSVADVSPPQPVQAYQQQVDSLFTFYLGKVGVADPGWRPTTRLSSRASSASTAYALPQAKKCPIVLFKNLFGHAQADQAFVLAHEVFHCIQGVMAAGSLPWKPWIQEGIATWAAQQAPGMSSQTMSAELDSYLWDSNLRQPARSLYAHAYDAFGFFVYLQNHAVDLWPRLTNLPAGNAEAFNQLVGDTAILADWPSGFFRDSSAAPEWNASGPGITSTRPDAVTDVTPVGNGQVVQLRAPAAAAVVATVDVRADVITIKAPGEGHLRFADGTEPAVPADGASYCTRVDKCTCPDGTVPPSIVQQVPVGALRLAFTAATAPTEVVVTGSALDCTTPSPVGSWHLVRLENENGPGGSSGTARLTSGSVTLVTQADETAQLDYNAATFDESVEAGGLSADADFTANGHGTIQLHYDPATHTVTKRTWSVAMTISGAGQQVSTSASLDPTADPGTLITYSVDSTSLVWTFTSTLGVSTYTWARD